jgi:VRR-NUC domain-containing protein
MRRARRVDANQAEIVLALRQAGCSVAILAECGQGIPDLLAGRQNVNYLIEVKMPGEGLNDEQREWHLTWRGETHVVESVEGALVAVGIFKRS